MNDLDRAKGWIAKGENENAIGLLASMLLSDKSNVDAWLLLGDLIDDPSRKKDCYRWALKLCPDDVQIQTRLQELETPPVTALPISAVSVEQPASNILEPDTRPTLRNIPRQSFPSSAPASQPKGGARIVGYVAGGVGAFLLILYLIANPENFSNEVLNIALVFMIFMAGIIILSAMNQNQR